jgi:hypothetical protein
MYFDQMSWNLACWFLRYTWICNRHQFEFQRSCNLIFSAFLKKMSSFYRSKRIFVLAIRIWLGVLQKWHPSKNAPSPLNCGRHKWTTPK